ncbi:MAG: aminotransferase class III-fold pyridoxal phosphate-dependent enzyme [Gammaproteobacteria bacterium]|nr:aminotransferase class III-fold pyridoxal phosphate-dependent enzyme [Gammaproteobacteria bacterium]MYF28539.1 aminotransferase class III-fold pyridoxal phosphate-dependent enzyme [Gammaproteobacteria bacterium]MYK45208.1 aminotransferase class III-fold pyridoxal phosphate-dependent enzyme [Gammaproteobacteria bacterium]
MGKIVDTYRELTPGSAAAQVRAERGVVGGNSRGAAYWKPYPLTIQRAVGTTLVDVDGREYTDMVNNYTALAHSHAYPPIVEAVTRQVAKGTSWVANNVWQAELAELLIERIPALESVRFTNSGSEAGILALTIARAITGRSKVLMARHGYHGILMEYEVGSFPGFMPHWQDNTYLGNYNDADSFEEILAEHGDEIAAVVLEPVMGAGGVFTATSEFLRRVQTAANAAGALFILDEVISFRLSEGGAQALYRIEPDLTMLGKVIGGGYPVGAVGGKLAHLRVFDPAAAKVVHSGTFCGNPVSMAAGLVSVRHLTSERIERMDQLAARLATGLTAHASNLSLPLSIKRNGSLMNVFFTTDEPRAPGRREDAQVMHLFFLAALNHGLVVAPRGLISLSTVMDEGLVDNVVRRAAAAMEDVVEEWTAEI